MGSSLITKGLILCTIILFAIADNKVHAQSEAADRVEHEPRQGPPREARPKEPIQFSLGEPPCAVIFLKNFCLNGSIEQQLQITPMDKLASYGLRDVYQHKKRGITTTMYAIDGKVANVLIEFIQPKRPEDRQGRRPRDQSREMAQRGDRPRPPRPPRGNLLTDIFHIVDRYAEQYGQGKGPLAIEQALEKIRQDGQGGQTWQFEQWHFYVEKANQGKITAEAFIPTLEVLEANAKIIKVGDKLTGIWRNGHKIEIDINDKTAKRLTGQLHFINQDRPAKAITIEQTPSGTLKLTAQEPDGSLYHLASDNPRGDKDRCYIWELLKGNESRPDAWRSDGRIKLCY